MSRTLPQRLLLGILAVYALVEFYPFTLSLYFLPHYAVLALCLVYLALYPDTRFIGPWNLKPVLFLLFWIAYNLFTYVWAMDQLEVLRYTAWILRYLALFLIFGKVFTQEAWLRRFEWFLFGVVLLWSVTAVWEMVTFQHLPVSKHYGELSNLPSGPFFGENHLAAYLLLLMPFLLFVPRLSGRGIWRNLSAVFAIVVAVILIIQGARIAMLAMGAFLLWFFIFQMRARQKLALALVLGVLAGGIYLRYHREIRLLYSLLQYQTETLGSERSSIYMSSIQIRQQLVSEAFKLASGSAFMGVGGGNFEPRIRSEAIYRTGGMSNPHNYLMELLGNWGIFILAGFVYLYLHWLLGLWRLYRKARGKERVRYLMYLVSLLLFLPTSLLPSSIRYQYFIWIYFAAVNTTLQGKAEPAPLEVAA